MSVVQPGPVHERELLPTEPPWDNPGGLGIREARSWATWQLAVAAAVAVVVGMVIGYSGKKTASSSSVAASGARTSGLDLGGPVTTVSSRVPPTGVRPGATQTTTTSTTAPTSTTVKPTAPANSPQVVLMPRTAGSGPDQLPTFTTGGQWNIGWAFSCVGAPGGSASFAIQVVAENGSSSGLVNVAETSRQGSGVTAETPSGKFHLQITTDPACQWAAKVTGVAG